MKSTSKTFIAFLIMSAATASLPASAQTNVYSRVNWQAVLKDQDYGNGPADGNFILKYSVVVGPLDPDNPWPTNCPTCNEIALGTNAITVNNGLFTTSLLMPTGMLAAAFTPGTNIFLEFAIKTNGAPQFTTLLPWQPLNATPYAIFAKTISDPLPAQNLTGTLASGQLGGSYGNVLSFVNPSNTFAGDGALLANVNATRLGGFDPCSLPCYWNLLGNGGTDPNVNFLGTTDNAALTIRVANTPALRINRSHGPGTSPNIIGGDPANSIDPVVQASVIGGGGGVYPNTIVGDSAVIAGGQGNHIEDQANVIGGGWGNSIDRSGGMPDPFFDVIGGGWSNTLSGAWSTIGGGGLNVIRLSTQGHSATIAGGYANLANGHMAAIGGGAGNTAGPAGFVGGGWANMATGDGSVVAGGSNNIASGVGAAIPGGLTNTASGIETTVAGGLLNNGSGAFAAIGGGRGNTNTANYATVGGGFQNLAAGQDAVVAGGSQNSVTSGQSAIGGGIANQIGGSSSTIAGGQQNYADTFAAAIGGGANNRISDGADYSVLGGGDANFVGQRILNLLEFGFQTNHAYVAVLNGGLNNTNIGYYSTLGGGRGNLIVGPLNNVEAAYSVVAGGLQNQVTAQNAGTISGGRDNSVGYDYAVVPGGRSAAPNNYGEMAFAAGHMDYVGDAQASTFVLRRKFIGNGDLFLNGDTSDSRITVPVGAVWTLHFQISAVSITNANFASYEISGMVANVGGTTTFRLMDGTGAVVGTARPIFETPGAVSWQATPYVNVDNSLRVAVFAGETVKWCGRIDATEVRR